MKKDVRYKLAIKTVKLNCPYCGAKKHWQRYIDTKTGELLPEMYGRCDNEVKCGKWNDPYKDGYAKMIWEQEQKVNGVTVPKQKYFRTQSKSQPQPKTVFFNVEAFKKTLQPDRYEQNIFIQNLLTRVSFPFNSKDIEKVISLYYLGTISKGYRAGSITFPFIDLKGNVRTIQVKQFNKANHTKATDFLHSIIEKNYTRNGKPLPEWLEAYIKQDKRVSCLFGEHLLSKYPLNPVALVEAPKTAVYGALYFGVPETPESLIWLAVYNKSSFSFDKLKVLQGRFVYVFPDLSKDGNTFKEWERKAKEYERRLPGTRFIFSDLLEHLAPERDKSEGYDLADYLIKKDWRLFRKREIQEQPTPTPVENEVCEKCEKCEPLKKTYFLHVEPLPKVEVSKKEQPENWSKDISALEAYFNEIEALKQPIKLNSFSEITDASKFIESHLSIIKSNNGKRAFLPYLNRLQELKQILTIKLN